MATGNYIGANANPDVVPSYNAAFGNSVQSYIANILGANSSDYTPSVYDVQNKQALAKQILGNQVQAVNPLGVIANTLAGGLSGYENKQAALEQQEGLTDANSQLAQALQGEDISQMVTAGGNPFLPQSESGLVGDLLKRKLGIGETFYGTPIVATDDQGNPHYYQAGSLGDTREMQPSQGMNWAPKQQFLDTGTGYQPVAQNAGINLGASGNGAGTPIAIENEQKALDTAKGAGEGKQIADAPINLQAEQQGVQLIDNQYQTASNAIKDAIAAADGWTTGTIGDVLKSAPGTPQYNLARKLDTVQAIIGFQTLQAIRNASKTGGGLGSISDFEEKLLSSVQGSLAQGQTPAQFKASLQRIQDNLDQLNRQSHQNYEQDYNRAKGQGANLNNVPGPISAPQSGGWKIVSVQ